jgi:hypothetical protein
MDSNRLWEVVVVSTLTGQSIDPINSNYTGVMQNIHS